MKENEKKLDVPILWKYDEMNQQYVSSLFCSISASVRLFIHIFKRGYERPGAATNDYFHYQLIYCLFPQ